MIFKVSTMMVDGHAELVSASTAMLQKTLKRVQGDTLGILVTDEKTVILTTSKHKWLS